MSLAENELLLQRFYSHVDDRPDETYLIQPHDGGQTTEYTFAQVCDEASKMAAHLKSLDFPAQSKIAIISKNCAHFFIAELAIWMAGHVTVALYPTLAADTVEYILGHSEAKLIFVGKLDDAPWKEIQKGMDTTTPRIRFPMAPESEGTGWYEAIEGVEPLAERPTRGFDDEARGLIAESMRDRGIALHTGTNIVDVYITLLRKKVDKNHDEKLIHTRVGLGYYFGIQ